MKRNILFFSGILLLAPTFVYGACSVANLTRCLDSVCAINAGANLAARCQYCGSSSAGEPEKSTAMKSVSAGASAKYTISDKQLKKAPSDPGERYVWGTKLCLEKVASCTSDDVEEIYDPLIEQSCKAAGISSEMQNLAKEINEEKTEGSCSTEIRSCVVDTKRCRADYRSCESDDVFDKYFSECGVLSTGCESFLAGIKNKLNSARLSAFENADQLLKTIVESYQKLREQKLANAQNSCKNNSAKDACMERVCKSNMRNKCAVGFEYEKTVADQLCKFYETACDRLK